MTLTSQSLSKVAASALLVATVGFYFSRLEIGYDGRYPVYQIVIGFWLLIVAHVWMWVWPMPRFWSVASPAEARRRAAVRAIPIVFTFAPTLLYAGTMFALPVPASGVLLLYIIAIVAAIFEPPSAVSPSAVSQSWLTLLPLLGSIASLVSGWFVCTCIILRRQRSRLHR